MEQISKNIFTMQISPNRYPISTDNAAQHLRDSTGILVELSAQQKVAIESGSTEERLRLLEKRSDLFEQSTAVTAQIAERANAKATYVLWTQILAHTRDSQASLAFGRFRSGQNEKERDDVIASVFEESGVLSRYPAMQDAGAVQHRAPSGAMLAFSKLKCVDESAASEVLNWIHQEFRLKRRAMKQWALFNDNPDDPNSETYYAYLKEELVVSREIRSWQKTLSMPMRTVMNTLDRTVYQREQQQLSDSQTRDIDENWILPKANGRVGLDWTEGTIHLYTEAPEMRTRDNPTPAAPPIDKYLVWSNIAMSQGEVVVFIDSSILDFVSDSWVGAWTEMLESHQKGEGKGRSRQIENDLRYREWSEWMEIREERTRALKGRGKRGEDSAEEDNNKGKDKGKRKGKDANKIREKSKQTRRMGPQTNTIPVHSDPEKSRELELGGN